MEATRKYKSSETASQMVVMNGLAITAGSKPILLAITGRIPPMNFATTTVRLIVTAMRKRILEMSRSGWRKHNSFQKVLQWSLQKKAKMQLTIGIGYALEELQKKDT